MDIKLIKFGSTLISRQSGKEAFAAFQSSLENIAENENVVIDFEGVITFSPSWGDEFLTPISKRFGNRLRLAHTRNPSVKATLEILEKSNGTKFEVIESLN